MKGKIFKQIMAVTMVFFLICFTLILFAAYGYSSDEYSRRLQEEAVCVAASAEQGGKNFLQQLGGAVDARVTWVAADGTVLYDSIEDASTMENHGGRKEIQQALENGFGESRRYSATLLENTYYCARRLSDGTVVRVSDHSFTVLTLLMNLFYPLVVMLALGILLSVFLAARVSRNVTDPINAIDLTSPDERDVYPELQPLVRRINAQNRQIRRQLSELKAEHERQDALRREFTANVSHELKTPLTSISGYAEIIRDGVVKPEDIGRFSGKIYDEAQRLITLVGDIIRLSQLESQVNVPEKTTVDLWEVCEGALSHMEHAARKKNVSLRLSGERVSVFGAEQILDEIVYNLCDNAVKYNKDGGHVEVVLQGGKTVDLTVRDNGIGIPAEELDRVFERFYRVDKSHSKEVGGTGLGLSIVKHGASYHQATISVDSTLGEGTAITVHFPLPTEPKARAEHPQI